jgi:Uma2 family endonuclease
MSTSFTNAPDFSPGELPLPPQPRMAEEEFIAWALATGAAAEWVDGEVVMMSPASREHSSLKVWLLTVLQFYCEERQVGTVLEDMMLRLSRRRRVRIPDIFFVAAAREHIIDHAVLREPPDMAIEIVSPDSVSRDWREKYEEYEEFGIREYWVIDPNSQSFDVYALDAADKYARLALPEGKGHSTVIPGFWIRPEWLAPETRPAVKHAWQELGVM